MTQLSASFADGLLDGVTGTLAPRDSSAERPAAPDLTGVLPRRPPRRLWPLLDAAVAAPVAGVLIREGGVTPLVALSLLLLWPLLLTVTGNYTRRVVEDSAMVRCGRVGRSAVGLAALCWLASAVPGLQADQAGVLPGVLALSATGLVTSVARTGRALPRVVLVGHPRDVRSALAELRGNGRYDVVGACLTRRVAVPPHGTTTVVGTQHAVEAAAWLGADALLVLPSRDLGPAALRRIAWAADRSRVQLYVGTCLLDVDPRRTRVANGGGLTLVHVAESNLCGPLHWVKEVVERILAATALLVLLPALVVVAVAIRRDSPGPVIFRQQRVGRHGRPFTMRKLRSMSGTAEEERARLLGVNEADGVLFKIQHDPRVTTVGRWLRRYSVDEVPQLWNVVTGDMSLVGPRPALPEEVASYDGDPRRRLAVKPGLTGLWQISGRSDLSWAEAVRLDLWYVDNWSPRLDLWILARTVRAVLDHRGAY